MTAITYKKATPVYENTVMKKFLIDGVHKQYVIQAIEGYVLHDNRLDYIEGNPDTMEETLKLGYTGEMVSCRYDYDFTANPFGFYAVPITQE